MYFSVAYCSSFEAYRSFCRDLQNTQFAVPKINNIDLLVELDKFFASSNELITKSPPRDIDIKQTMAIVSSDFNILT